jgi:hypothetical protein
MNTIINLNKDVKDNIISSHLEIFLIYKVISDITNKKIPDLSLSRLKKFHICLLLQRHSK